MKLRGLARRALVLLLVAAGIGCTRTAWNDLHDLEDLTTLFEGDVGEARIVLLLSPT